MKRYFVILFTVFASLTAAAQSRGLKIAYIDMEYILSKAPDFAEAKNQLEQRAAKWKQEMDAKRNEIAKLKEGLQAERALLTKELIEEREEDIAFKEKELSDYQEQKFGPKGELITQKTVLVKPVQDQVFSIVQDLADVRKYDFVFDKSSDLTMIFSAKKHDISDLIVRRLSRSAKQEKITSKQAKKLEEQEQEEEKKSDPDYVDRQKVLDDKKAARQKAIDDRKAAADAKRAEAEARRQKVIEDRKAAREAAQNKTSGTTPAAKSPTDGDDDAPASTNKEAAPAEEKTNSTDAPAEDKNADARANRDAAIQASKDAREEKQRQRQEAIDKRKKEIDDKREAARKEREEKQNANKQNTTSPGEPSGDDDAPAGEN